MGQLSHPPWLRTNQRIPIQGLKSIRFCSCSRKSWLLNLCQILPASYIGSNQRKGVLLPLFSIPESPSRPCGWSFWAGSIFPPRSQWQVSFLSLWNFFSPLTPYLVIFWRMAPSAREGMPKMPSYRFWELSLSLLAILKLATRKVIWKLPTRWNFSSLKRDWSSFKNASLRLESLLIVCNKEKK